MIIQSNCEKLKLDGDEFVPDIERLKQKQIQLVPRNRMNVFEDIFTKK